MPDVERDVQDLHGRTPLSMALMSILRPTYFKQYGPTQLLGRVLGEQEFGVRAVIVEYLLVMGANSNTEQHDLRFRPHPMTHMVGITNRVSCNLFFIKSICHRNKDKDKDPFIGPQEFVLGYSKAHEQPQSSARSICHSHAMTSTGHEPATIRIAAWELAALCTSTWETSSACSFI